MVDMLRDMWEDGWVGRSILALLILMVALIPLGIWAAVEEQKEWETFSAAHECKVVGRMSGSTQTGVGYGVTANGQFGTVVTTTSTPSKTGYLCNDGVTYWR
jgi:hypothetical protein